VCGGRRATLDGKPLLGVLPPRRPVRQDPPIPTQAAPMMNVEDEVDECVRVVHPAEVQDHRRVEVAQTVRRESLDDGRDENGERGHEDGRRLSLDCLELLRVDLPVYERIERRCKAEKVLGIDCYANTNAGDVRVCRNQAHGEGQQEKRTAKPACKTPNIPYMYIASSYRFSLPN
jgi:hypothetical protein